MYNAPNSTREKALLAAAAADRAMKRSVCCKSQFKFKCFSCGEMIHRGDKITITHGGEGMTLRFRGSDCFSGLAGDETCFYQPSTGCKRWVHIGCNPCEWHGFLGVPEDEGFTPQLVGVWTDWGAKIESEFREDYALTGRWDMEEFLERNGYPQEKYMSDRIKHAVTRFQALWRGYIYKKAYPWALKQKRATEAINLNHHLYRPHTTFEEGEEGEMLYDEGTPEQTIFSFTVQHKWTSEEFGGENYVVNFHSEPNNFKNYTRHRLCVLTAICKEHKRKVGIEAKVTGHLNTARLMQQNSAASAASRSSITHQHAADLYDWRYRYPDGTVVE